ncbi:MAG: hypothetical protein J6P03_03410 [Opitutales bacterium]|nr:hypothetical protein [Opitutales bacterium]
MPQTQNIDPQIAAAILALLQGPKSYAIDGETITAQSIPDAIAAAKFLRGMGAAAAQPWRSFARCRISTQGPERD